MTRDQSETESEPFSKGVIDRATFSEPEKIESHFESLFDLTTRSNSIHNGMKNDSTQDSRMNGRSPLFEVVLFFPGGPIDLWENRIKQSDRVIVRYGIIESRREEDHLFASLGRFRLEFPRNCGRSIESVDSQRSVCDAETNSSNFY